MLRLTTILFLSATLILTGCFSSRGVSTWKSSSSMPFTYHKIMVAGVLGEAADSLRLAVEKYAASELNVCGHVAVAACEEFGVHGLEQLGQAATYQALCDKGIDAVLTIALVPDSNALSIAQGDAKKHTAFYYFNHIWGYHFAVNEIGTSASKWEMILFDVRQLQPVFLIQSDAKGPAPASGISFTGMAIKKLSKSKMLRKSERSYRKPF